MASTLKVYPATQAQVAAVDAKLDVINGKLPLPTYQIKTVNPSNVQQTVTPDSGYSALSGVVVNPIAALMPENLEDFVMKKNTMPEFSLSLSGDVPDYACYHQSKLVAVYGTLTSIGLGAFSSCTNLQEIDCRVATSIKDNAFQHCTNLQEIDCRVATSIGSTAFQHCTNLQEIDCRAATSIGSGAFSNCINLNLIDITNTHTATLANINAIPNNANLTILVADATDKAHYQSATNWSTSASKIKTVAEFETEIGMSYDDYYLQIFGHARN